MNFVEWSKPELEYGRKLVNSGLAGARSGREEFLQGKPLAPFLNESAHKALGAAALGVGLGMLGSFAANRPPSPKKALTYGFVGAVIGFVAGLAWENRSLGSSIVCSAWKNIGHARDEHWLEENPIDYA